MKTMEEAVIVTADTVESYAQIIKDLENNDIVNKKVAELRALLLLIYPETALKLAVSFGFIVGCEMEKGEFRP